MDDLISRQAAIDAVSKGCQELRGVFGRCEENLLDLPSAQRWIPCSEQLPDYNVPVLTWDSTTYQVEKRIPCIIGDDAEPIFSEWWVSDEYDEDESLYYPNLRDGAAIAWMPLPEPYREDGENDG